MPDTARHNTVAGSLATTTYRTVGPWSLGTLLKTITITAVSTNRNGISLVFVTHASATANEETIRAGTPILDQSQTRIYGVNSMTIIPSTTATMTVSLPLNTRILHPAMYLHILIHDPGPVAGTKTMTFHVAAETPDVTIPTGIPTAREPVPFPPRRVIAPTPRPPTALPRLPELEPG